MLDPIFKTISLDVIVVSSATAYIVRDKNAVQ